MKYHLLSRTLNPSVITGKQSFTYLWSFDTLEQVKEYVGKTPYYELEYKVIKGTELTWKEETEEVITKTVIVKSRTLNDE